MTETAQSLTVIEQRNFADLERKLEGLKATVEKAFYEIGGILMEIRDNKYYRETHGTFEEYCKERWGFERTYAYRLMKSSEVVENLLPIGNKIKNESQVRPLTKLPPEKQKAVYVRAVKTAPDGKITARHVAETVRRETEGRGETAHPARSEEGRESEQSAPEEHRDLMVEYDDNDDPGTRAMEIANQVIIMLVRIPIDNPKRKQALLHVIEWCTTNMAGR